jgi:hypothetical protein
MKKKIVLNIFIMSLVSYNFFLFVLKVTPMTITVKEEVMNLLFSNSGNNIIDNKGLWEVPNVKGI